MRKNAILGLLLVLVSFSVVGVSAFIYEQASQTVSQTILEIATITLQNSALGDIEEGETITYTNATVSSLGDAISITTTKASVYLYLESDLDSISITTYYTTYNIVVKFATVPGGSSHSSGDTACTLSMASPDYSSIGLDVAGSWTFNFEVTTTAKSVNSNQPTTVTINVSAQSAS